MNIPAESSRPDKLTHTQTILYEIDMFRFAARNFRGDAPATWQNLECFLLHFRNLIEFFGKLLTGDDTLSVLKPATFTANHEEQEELKKLHRNDLWRKYEVDRTDTISRYLQHCTEERVINKTWKVREMFSEVSPLLEQFEKIVPNKSSPWRRAPDLDGQQVSTLVPECARTGTAST